MPDEIYAKMSGVVSRGVKIYAQESMPQDKTGLWIDTKDNTGAALNKIWFASEPPTEYTADTAYTGYAYSALTGAATPGADTVAIGDVVFCGDGFIGSVAALADGNVKVLMLKSARIDLKAQT